MPVTQFSGKRARAVLHERRALALRTTGLCYARIAEAMGLSESGARMCVVRAIGRLEAEVSEAASEVKRLELERLDRMQTALWAKAAKGDTKAIDSSLRVMERRARLVGLDAPILFNWRKDAERMGIPVAEVFDQMVGAALREIEQASDEDEEQQAGTRRP